MAYQFNNNPIPITTVSSDDYPRPSQNKDGQWVVSASAVKLTPNKVILYSPISKVYTPVHRFTVTPDYYAQVKSYEDRLAKQAYGWADGLDNHKINSIADLLTMHGFSPNFPWSKERIQQNAETWEAAKQYFKEYMLSPMIGDAPFFGKQGKLVQGLQNGLVNFNETIDLVTGANLVKGFIQDGTEGIKKGLNWDNTGRMQYNWNVHPTGTALDTVINIGLEVISDPTNWISLGTGIAAKTVAKNSIKNVLYKSADDVGLQLLDEPVDALADALATTAVYKYTAGSHLTDYLRVKSSSKEITKILKNAEIASPDALYAFGAALKTNAEAIQSSKAFNILTSVRSGLDESQKIASKVAAWSSTLGLSYHGIRAAIKTGKKVMPYMNSVYNNIFKNTDIVDMPLSSYTTTMQDVELHLTKLQDVADLSKQFPIETVREATRIYQDIQYRTMETILTQPGKPSAVIFKEFNEYAQKHGSTDGLDLFTTLQQVNSVLPDDMRSKVQDLANTYARIFDETVEDVIQKAQYALDTNVLMQATTKEFEDVTSSLKTVENLGVLNKLIAPDLYTQGYISLQFLKEAKNVLNNKTLISAVDKYDLDILKKPTILKTEYDLESMGGHPVNGATVVTVNFDMQSYNSTVKQLNIINALVSQFHYRPRFKVDLDTLRKVLVKWNEGLEDITVQEVTAADAALHSIQHKFNIIRSAASKFSQTDLENGINASKESLDKLANLMESFVEDYNHRIAKNTEDASFYTDPHIAKANARNINMTARDIISHQAHAQGLDKSKIDEMIIAADVPDSNTVFEGAHTVLNDAEELVQTGWQEVTSVYEHLTELAALLENMRLNDYFVKELGLEETIAHWTSDTSKAGVPTFTMAEGKHLLEKIDILIDHVKSSGNTEGGVVSTQYVAADRVMQYLTKAGLDTSFNARRALATKYGIENYTNTTVQNAQLLAALKKNISINGQNDDVWQEALTEDVTIAPDGTVIRTPVVRPVLTYPTYNTAPGPADILVTVQLFRDELEDTINFFTRHIVGSIKFTTEALSSPIYKNMLTKSESLRRILGLQQVQDVLGQIRDNVGIGKLTDLLCDPEEDSALFTAVSNLKSTSKSVMLANRFSRLVDDSKALTSEEKVALRDAMAEESQRHRVEIKSPEYFTAELLNRMKDFFDGTHSAHSARLHELTDDGDPVKVVNKIYDLLNSPASLEGQQVKHTNASGKVWYTTESSVRSEQRYWLGAINAIAENNEKMYNIIYSATQTGYRTGTLAEVAFKKPDGTLIKVVDKEMRNILLRTLDEETAAKVYGKSVTEVKKDIRARMKNDTAATTVVCNTTEEFARTVFNLFKTFKEEAYAQHLIPRLIGFNNAMDSLGTDKIFAHFMDINKINVHIVYNNVDYKSLLTMRSFDIAQHLRIWHEGAYALTDATYDAILNIVQKMQTYQNWANADTRFETTKLMPDFNSKTLDALRNLTAAVQNTIDYYKQINAKNLGYTDVLDEDELISSAVSPDNVHLTAVSEKQYELLTTAFTLDELDEYALTLRDTLKNLGEVLHVIGEANDQLGRDLLISRAIGKNLGIPNITTLTTAGEGGSEVFTNRKVYDPKLFNEWFNIDEVNAAIKRENDGGVIMSLNKLAEDMQYKRSRIEQIHLVMDLSNPAILHTIKYLREILLSLPNHRYSTLAKYIGMLRLDRTQLDNFVIAQKTWEIFKAVADEPTIKTVLAGLDNMKNRNISLMMHYIQFPDDSVWSKDALYTPGIPVEHSQLIEDSAYVMGLYKGFKEVAYNDAHAKTFESLINTDLLIAEQAGVSLPSIQIKREFIEVWGTFTSRIKFLLKHPEEWYQRINPKGAERKFQVRTQFNKRIEQIVSYPERCAVSNNIRRNETIMQMGAKNFPMFLYKYAQGIQVYDMAAESFKNNPQLMTNFMIMLQRAQQYGVYYFEDLTRHELHVYVDPKKLRLPKKFKKLIPEDVKANLIKNKASALEWYDAAKEYFKLKVDLIPHLSYEEEPEPFFNAFADVSNKLDEFFNNEFSLSMHRTMSVSKYNQLREYLPKEIVDKLIPLDYLDEHDLIDGVFMQTMMGDYGAGAGKIFTEHSKNLITNVAAGFNVAINRVQGKDLYASTLFNPQNFLRTWTERVHNPMGVTYEEVRKAVHTLPIVIADLVDGRVVQVDISTRKKYEQAIQSTAVVLSYQSYARAVEVLNDNTINSKFYKRANKYYFSALKLGQILSVPTLVRNYVDSLTKGLIQSRDPAFFMRLLEVRHLIPMFEETYSKIFIAQNGKMSDRAVTEFYAKHANEVKMPVELFKKMLTFDVSSSANPTAVQLALNNNLVKKFYMAVKDTALKEEDCAYALSIFKTTHTYAQARAQLEKVYSVKLVDIMMLWRKKIPKQELEETWFSQIVNGFPVTRRLLDANMQFERLVRMTVFLEEAHFGHTSMSAGFKAADFSQFNRRHDPRWKRWVEFLFPFSSFQMDNFLFWTESLKGNRNNLIALTEDIISGAWDEEKIDTEELSRNMSVQYLFMSGNLILDDETGLSLKLNGSLHNALQILAAPVQTAAESLNVPMDELIRLIGAIGADEAKYAEDPYNNIKPISKWGVDEYSNNIAQLIPLVGAMWVRWHSAAKKALPLKAWDMTLPLLMPGMFGITKVDSSIPIGLDWYNQTEEYKKTHRYVFGVSYVPSWMRKDPTTYVNTFQRLQDLGYTKEEATEMMQSGWYMTAPDYQLKKYQPYRQYTRKVYAKRTYPRRSYVPKKTYVKFKQHYNNFYGDNIRISRSPHTVRRIYRQRLYDNLYTRTGVPRALMIQWRGANRSSRQLIRDRSMTSRLRQQRIIRQVKPLR